MGSRFFFRSVSQKKNITKGKKPGPHRCERDILNKYRKWLNNGEYVHLHYGYKHPLPPTGTCPRITCTQLHSTVTAIVCECGPFLYDGVRGNINKIYFAHNNYLMGQIIRTKAKQRGKGATIRNNARKEASVCFLQHNATHRRNSKIEPVRSSN